MGLRNLMARNKASETMKKKEKPVVPEHCDRPMKPSFDSDGNKIWICPLCLHTQPRE